MLLALQNLSFAFDRKNFLLKEISLSLEEKKIYALMGANGSGKTTLFNLITGFLKPTKGNILFNDQNIDTLPPYQINRRGIARTFQNVRFISRLTVRENIILAMRNHPTETLYKAILPEFFYKKELRQLEKEADEIIAEHFLDHESDSPANEISFGQQKLLNIACCVANNSLLLLLDEPVAGINPEFQNRITNLLKLLREKGKTVLMIEHNSDFISEVADKVFFLSEGKVSAYDSIEKLKTDPIVFESYI